MTTFVTHPSIRIKGTENNYDPILCMDTNCVNKNPHMHCPFCLKTEAYLDPVILKAHYRVKHVDKGIEFAGLKVLRCCDHCDIVGSIKGAKDFRGAHWHCYRCRNGFNRRDEAIKHFRTHFRNPQTTFQIQVNEEVNQMFNLSSETDDNGDVLADFGGVTSIITEISASPDSDDSPGDSHAYGDTSPSSHPRPSSTPLPHAPNTCNGSTKQEVHVSVAANETVGTSDVDTHAIMIIDASDLNAASPQSAATMVHTVDGTVVDSFALQNVMSAGWMEKQAELEQRINEMNEQNLQLAIAKDSIEQELRAELHQLKLQVSAQEQQMSTYQKREQELLEQLSIPLNTSMQQLLSKMAADHEDLLHQQLAYLRRAYLQPVSNKFSAAAAAAAQPHPQQTLFSSDGEKLMVINSKEENFKTYYLDGDNDCNVKQGDELATGEDGKEGVSSANDFIDAVSASKKRCRETDNGDTLERTKVKKGS